MPWLFVLPRFAKKTQNNVDSHFFKFRYLAGTEEGHIHRCSCSYNEQYLDSYFGHTVSGRFSLKKLLILINMSRYSWENQWVSGICEIVFTFLTKEVSSLNIICMSFRVQYIRSSGLHSCQKCSSAVVRIGQWSCGIKIDWNQCFPFTLQQWVLPSQTQSLPLLT